MDGARAARPRNVLLVYLHGYTLANQKSSSGDPWLGFSVNKVFDLRPAAIIDSLDLRKPQYKQLAAYGHVGREDLDVAWEKTDRINALLEAVK